MAPAIPGSRGLFSPLQTVLSPHKTRLYLTKDAHDFLDDFRWLAHNLDSRPTRLFELVPSPPLVIGATDASGIGLGGVFFIPTDHSSEAQPQYHAFVWRHRLPDTIRSRLISTSNPTGTITNSDLELAAAVAHPDVIASTSNITEITIAALHDNTPTVFWQRRGSVTTTGPAAYLLRLHARHLRYISTHDYIPGPINAMADDASRLVSRTALTFQFCLSSARALDRMRPITRDEFTRDYSAVQAALRSGVVLGRTAKATHTWDLWLAFCTKHEIDPWFTDQEDPIPYLQVFGQRYRDGRLAPGQKPVRSRTVADALCLVGQTYKLLGARDHRLDHHTGQIDFRLQRQFRAYEKSDPPPQRVKPIPIRLVSTVLTAAHNNINPSSAAQAIADMICIAFFFLLRSGEYTFTNANTPFRIQDVKLHIDTKEIQIYHASPLEFSNVTSVSLTFITQKNGVKGEVISHGRSGDLLVCPCRATVRRIQHLLQHQQPPSTPLCKFFQDHTHATRPYHSRPSNPGNTS
jgi:hypothetical protein